MSDGQRLAGRSNCPHMYIMREVQTNNSAESYYEINIVSDLPTNISDHFPVRISLRVLVMSKELNIADNGVSSFPGFPRVDWSDNKNCTAYSRYMYMYMDVPATSLPGGELPGVNFDTVTSRDEARKAVESMCNDAVTVTHEYCSSVADVGGIGTAWSRVIGNGWHVGDTMKLRRTQE